MHFLSVWLENTNHCRFLNSLNTYCICLLPNGIWHSHLISARQLTLVEVFIAALVFGLDAPTSSVPQNTILSNICGSDEEMWWLGWNIAGDYSWDKENNNSAAWIEHRSGRPCMMALAKVLWVSAVQLKSGARTSLRVLLHSMETVHHSFGESMSHGFTFLLAIETKIVL